MDSCGEGVLELLLLPSIPLGAAPVVIEVENFVGAFLRGKTQVKGERAMDNSADFLAFFSRNSCGTTAVPRLSRSLSPDFSILASLMLRLESMTV